jgi:hypothetical protein
MFTRNALLLFSLCAACGGSVAPETSSAPTPSPAQQATPVSPPSSQSGATQGSAGTEAIDAGQIHSVPNLPWNDAAGCGNFFIYSDNADRQRVLVISGNRDELGLETLGQSKTVSVYEVGNIYVEHFATPLKEIPYCTDALSGPPPASDTWKVTGGTLTFTLTGVGREGDAYQMSVSTHALTFVNAQGGVESVPDRNFTGIVLGWLPG